MMPSMTYIVLIIKYDYVSPKRLIETINKNLYPNHKSLNHYHPMKLSFSLSSFNYLSFQGNNGRQDNIFIGIELHSYLKVSRIPTLNPSTNWLYNVFTTKFNNLVVDSPEVQNQNVVLACEKLMRIMKGKKINNNLFLP